MKTTILDKLIMAVAVAVGVAAIMAATGAYPVGQTRAAGGHEGGGGEGGSSSGAGGLKNWYAAFPGEVQPGQRFTAVLVLTDDAVPVSGASPSLVYEFLDVEGDGVSEIGGASTDESQPGVYTSILTLKYAGSYRLTYSFTHNDATVTQVATQVINHPHVEMSGASGDTEIEIHNFNELTAAAGQVLEFDIEDIAILGDPTFAIYLQDRSGLLNLTPTAWTVSDLTLSGTHYESPAVDLSAAPPSWELTITSTGFGEETLSITLP